ncbi:MAG: ATP-binding protein [Nitrospirae bacterium]|nr:ATP-binding protein [Nitrospirota bacterium]MCL5977534.1 ATP-binding protein [Nitrospirota bacterium]
MKTGRRNNRTYPSAGMEDVERKNTVLLRYIRDKVNQLLQIMGTKPLREEELNDESLIAVDPIGIIAESFEQVLEHLQESNRQLQIARDYLQAVFDTAGVGISIIDRDLRIIKCNEKQKELLANGIARIEGEHCYEVYCGIDSPSLMCPAIETLETGRAGMLKEVIKKGRVFQIATSPLKDKKGDIIGVVEVNMDITEKKRAEDAMCQSEKLAAVGQLAAGIAHELNNPLGNILGYAKLLLMDKNTAESQRERVKVIVEQAKMGSGIIKGLLEFSHQKMPVFERISINTCIERALQSLNGEIEGNNIEVLKRLGKVPHVMADPKQMEQVVYNILLNAVQSMEGTGGTAEVRSEAVNGAVEVTIKDDGPGIHREHLCRIFEPFFTTKPVGKGTGLGLSICSEILKKHGSNIRVESEKGKGAKFYFRLNDGGVDV